MRPAEFCRGLLVALEESEDRRRRRQRDTTADAIGLGIKRDLVEAAIADDPPPEDFERWLMDRCLAAAATVSEGAARAMAQEIFAEWRLLTWGASKGPHAPRGGSRRPGEAVTPLVNPTHS